MLSRGSRHMAERDCPSWDAWGAFAWVAEANSARLPGPGRPEHGYNGATPRVCSLGPI
jgi:hypothetical protein